MDSSENNLIKKEVLYIGSKFIPMTAGTRIKFHFETKRADNQNIVDDSRKMKKPMELVLGKKFKLECWEAMVQKMSLHEVARFSVDKSLVQNYPFVAKTIRDAHKCPEERKHCCGMTIQNEGLGYPELDELLNCPSDLIFTFEVLSIELPEEYEKETWQLEESEKLDTIESYRLRGNEMFKENLLDEAAENYAYAMGIVEQLMLKHLVPFDGEYKFCFDNTFSSFNREKPNDEEWNKLALKKIPLLLNYSQCMLIQKNYYKAIECCTEVLKYDPNNLKAYFRRAKAHVGAWDSKDAEKDFQRCVELDPNLKNSVAKEIAILKEKIREQDEKSKSNFKKLF